LVPSDKDRALGLDAYNHRLCRSVATACGRPGVPRQTIPLILGHTSMPGVAVTAAYD
jgi:hypothetical protein